MALWLFFCKLSIQMSKLHLEFYRLLKKRLESPDQSQGIQLREERSQPSDFTLEIN